jgi:putative spermidine/putrescine transport system substrate-binding protein
MPRKRIQIAVILAMAAIGLSTGLAHAQQGGQIVYLGIGGATQDALRKAYFEPFQKETGIRIVEDTGLSVERVQSEVQSGHPTIDVTNISTAAYEKLLAKGLLAPIDYKYYDPTNSRACRRAASVDNIR